MRLLESTILYPITKYMDTYSAPSSRSKIDFRRQFGFERHVEVREAFDPHPTYLIDHKEPSGFLQVA